MRQTISHLTVAAAGIAVGIFYQGFNTQPNINLGDTESVSAIVDTKEQAVLPDQDAGPMPVQKSGELSDQKPDKNVVSQLETASSDSNTGNNDFNLLTDNAEAGSPGSLGFLKDANMGMLETGELDSLEANLQAMINGSENPGKDIMDFLTSDSSDEEKHVLEYLISKGSAMGTVEGLDASMIKQLALASESDYQQWEELMSLLVIDSAEARDELFSALPNISSERIVSSSIDAIRPQLIPPADRAQLLSNLSAYADSDSDEVKSAAILALGQWSAHDYSYILEGALASDNVEQQGAALMAITEGQLWSDDIEFHAKSIMNNESLPVETRMQAFNALSYRSLNEADYADFYRFYEEYALAEEAL